MTFAQCVVCNTRGVSLSTLFRYISHRGEIPGEWKDQKGETLLDLDVKTRFFCLCALISTLIFNIGMGFCWVCYGCSRCRESNKFTSWVLSLFRQLVPKFYSLRAKHIVSFLACVCSSSFWAYGGWSGSPGNEDNPDSICTKAVDRVVWGAVFSLRVVVEVDRKEEAG